MHNNTLADPTLLTQYLHNAGIRISPQEFFQKLSQEDQVVLLQLLHKKQQYIQGKCQNRLEFAQKYHKTHKDTALDFTERHALRKLYEDESQVIVVQKSVQVGVSEFAVVDHFYNVLEKGWSGAYILTKSALRNKFVAERVDRLLLYCEYYKSHKGKIDNLQMKTFGKGTVYYLGSNASDEFVSFPADFVIIDELDRCDMTNIALVPDRLQASPHKFRRYISNPTVEGYGINSYFSQSDKKQWHIRCTHCNTSQILDWYNNCVQQIDEFSYTLYDPLYIRCIKCAGNIERFSMGEWVAERTLTQADSSGYLFSQLFSPTVSLSELYKEFIHALGNSTQMQRFQNSCLGLPFNAEGAKFTEGMLKACEAQYSLDDEYTGMNTVYAGIDIGAKLHIVIREHTQFGFRALYIGYTNTFEDAIEICQQYKVNVAVFDSRPELHKVRDMQEKYDWVWAADYYTQPTLTDISVQEERRIIKANRTEIIDTIYQNISKRTLINPIYTSQMLNGMYYDHLKASTRVQVPDGDAFVWVHTEDDHFLHAEVYCYLATKTHTEPSIIVIGSRAKEDIEQSDPLEEFWKQSAIHLLDFFYKD